MGTLESWHGSSVAQGKSLSTAWSLSLCLLLLYFAPTPVLAVDPNRHISQYAHTAWRVQDGAFSGIPRTIAQSADGYVWIGTTSGLLRFDSVNFVPWIPTDSKGGFSNAITALAGARDGSLWIGAQSSRTTSTLTRLANHQITTFPTGLGRINSILEDHNGTIWISGLPAVHDSTSLCRVVASEIRCFSKYEIPASGSDPLAEDNEGNLWIGTDTSLVRWKPGFTHVWELPGLRSNQGMDGVTGLAAPPQGSLWLAVAGTGPGLGLQRLVSGVPKSFRLPGFDGSTVDVETLLLDRSSALWIGTYDQGIYRIHGDDVDHFASADGLSGDRVYHFCERAERGTFGLRPREVSIIFVTFLLPLSPSERDLDPKSMAYWRLAMGLCGSRLPAHWWHCVKIALP